MNLTGKTMSDLIERLRKASESIVAWGNRYGTYAPLEKYLADAADALEAKDAEIERLLDVIEQTILAVPANGNLAIIRVARNALAFHDRKDDE